MRRCPICRRRRLGTNNTSGYCHTCRQRCRCWVCGELRAGGGVHRACREAMADLHAAHAERMGEPEPGIRYYRMARMR
jgi:hypothetical protein